MFSLKCVIILVLCQLSLGEKLPYFFKLCNKNNANLGKCVEDNANIVLPHILKGVEELDSPPLTNLELPKIYAPNYVPYDFNFESNIANLEGVTYNNSEFDIKNLVARCTFLFPKLELKGKYKIHGFVGKLLMAGKGHANVTLHNVSLNIMPTFALFQLNGTNYFKTVSLALTSYNINSISYNFDNLFDGDKVQEAIANQMLNKYWGILAGNFLPHVPIYLVELTHKVANKLLGNTTIDDIFPPY